MRNAHPEVENQCNSRDKRPQALHAAWVSTLLSSSSGGELKEGSKLFSHTGQQNVRVAPTPA